ncbi:histidinol-phosphatase [Temperatibacter marinus]|uniref:Histidinol-phosphatase n=1 Tax=Temperatibacter marinus TaxID=1456591 RepID=A0AA52HA02_9PROT|nr:histidinol-phosphatase [Temperatibacter marinus]WND03097.1 histidinol-phosphatase [Temperatibacter marinus]
MITDDFLREMTAVANRLADAAAKVTLTYFRQSGDVTNKLDQGFDPVTEGDKGAEKAIRAILDSDLPHHGIIGEEFGRKNDQADLVWTLDPIDGTRAFISGLPTWGTLIALSYKGVPILGVIDQPYIKERFVGSSLGSTLNGVPITTRKCSNLSHATISTTAPELFVGSERELWESLQEKTQLTRYGLDCYAYAILSAGHIDVVMETGLQIYDMAALIPVIRGAGGVATNWSGSEAGENCNSEQENGRLLAYGDPALKTELLTLTKGY